VLQDFKDCFPPELPSGLPPDRGVGHTIALEPGSRPVHRAMYRLSPAERVEVKSTVEALLSKGLIEPTSSPFGSPILFVAKKDGSLRMVIDYRALNRLTIRNRTPLPRIDDLFDRVQGATVFTSSDLTSGYHQILITDDRAKTVFLTPSGSYQFKVLPFGLTSAPATFQVVLNRTLKGLEHFCVVYMDDILIFSKDPNMHAKHLRLVLDRLRAS
jgi:hypothetical protein